ncbi:squalene/phytoene synthase family protein [Halomonas denitrificans]|nr:squalene/phytoene synthase family protein [Halomonas denitrificans]
MAAASTDGPETDSRDSRPLAWCAERLLVPGNPLTLSRPYAAEALRDPLLALRSVIGEIARVPGEVSDSDVGRRKLGWWRQALTEHLPHPALQALSATGAAAPQVVAELLRLVEAVETTLDAPRFETVAAFDAHARALAGPAARAEARLVEPDAPEQTVAEPLVALTAGAYRVRMVRDLVLDARQQRWLVPLELQAEFQVTRQQVAAGEQSHRTRALLAWMAGQAVTEMTRAEASMAPTAAWRHRHAVLHAGLDARLGRRIVRRPGRAMKQRLPSVGPLAALVLWRHARNLRRRVDRAG